MSLSIVILCGGKGSRIRCQLGNTPKILAPIKERVFLDYVVYWLTRCFEASQISIYLSTGIGHQLIENYVKANNISCILSKETKPLGTLGALIDVVKKNNIVGDLLVMNGDTIFDMNLSDVYRSYLSHSSDPLLIVKKVSEVSRFGGYKLINERLRLSSLNCEYISLGAFFCQALIVDEFIGDLGNGESYLMLDRDLIDKMGARAYVIDQYKAFIDIGIPEDYKHAQEFIPALIDI